MSYKFIGNEFVFVEDTPIAEKMEEIIAALPQGDPDELVTFAPLARGTDDGTGSEMCPFCPLFVEDVWCQPIDPDFLGKPAMIGDVPSCGSCYTHACSEFGGFERYLRLLREAKQEAAR